MEKLLKLFIWSLLACLLVSCGVIPQKGAAPVETAKPAEISTVTAQTQTITAQKVTLLVPLTGNLGGSGTAVRNGFFAAYYHSNSNNLSNLSVKVVDTNGGNITNLYQKAVSDGSTMIVGPLTKPEIEKLSRTNSLTVPTLALNTLDNYAITNVPNLYQFGLASSDEVAQLVDRAKEQNFHRAVIIAPNDSWGQNIASMLRNNWQSTGGTIVSTLQYNKGIDADSKIRDTFQITYPQDESGKTNNKALPIARSDVDVIFLIASPIQGRQIQPLLRFYLLDKIPVLSISSIYSGKSNQFLDRDLDGVIFCDIPWVFGSAALSGDLEKLRENVSTLWPASYKKYNRLYALGIDAYYLSAGLDKLSSTSGIQGTTGILYVDNHHHVFRKLDWAKMKHGVPVLLKIATN
jgi:outer membrane PBP1 activator LpoA protein